MRKWILSIVCTTLLGACGDRPQQAGDQHTSLVEKTVQDSTPLTISEVKYEELMDYIRNSKSSYIVMNFWATWCVPCVKEMPYFFKVKNSKAWDNVDWVFVSLDEARLLDSKVKDFLFQNNYSNATHFLLNDNGRQQLWIDIISPQWSGSIPATAIYHDGVLIDFHEGMLSEQELLTLLQKNIKS